MMTLENLRPLLADSIEKYSYTVIDKENEKEICYELDFTKIPSEERLLLKVEFGGVDGQLLQTSNFGKHLIVKNIYCGDNGFIVEVDKGEGLKDALAGFKKASELFNIPLKIKEYAYIENDN